MKKRNYFLSTFIVAAMSFCSALAQDHSVIFAILGSSEKPTSIKVENTTQGTEKTLSGTDVLNLVAKTTGIDELNTNTSNALQIYPNPVGEVATLTFNNPEAGKVAINLVNTAGVQLAKLSNNQRQGELSYTVSGLSTGNYILSVQSGSYRSSCVVISYLDYGGTPEITLNSTQSVSQMQNSTLKAAKVTNEIIQMQYTSGDVLKFTATMNAKNAYIADYIPTQNDEVEFSFTYKVIFNNWDNAELSAFEGEYGDAVIYPSHPNNRNGYSSNGWDTENATLPANDDLVITAQYSTIPFTISYNNVGTKNTAANPISYKIETTNITLVVPTDSADYTFEGWFTDAAFTDTVSTPAIAQGSMGDTIFYAKWTRSTHYITYNNVGTKNPAANLATYTNETADITLVVPTDSTNYTFGGWFTNATFTDTVSTPAIVQGSIGDIAFYAKWANNPITDSRDGTVYQTVTIGNQIWMAENLKYLPSVAGHDTGSTTEAFYYVYGYNGTNVTDAKAISNYATYGVLYNWPAAMNGAASSSTNPSGIQGVCPTGSHLPSDAEWVELIGYLGGVNIAGGKLKETGTSHWKSPNTGATNITKFRALPGWLRDGYTGFPPLEASGFWWSTTEYNSTQGYNRHMYFHNTHLDKRNTSKAMGLSVRCLRD